MGFGRPVKFPEFYNVTATLLDSGASIDEYMGTSYDPQVLTTFEGSLQQQNGNDSIVSQDPVIIANEIFFTNDDISVVVTGDLLRIGLVTYKIVYFETIDNIGINYGAIYLRDTRIT